MRSNAREWFKLWGTLLVAVAALGLSGYAVHIERTHYQEVIKPHTQHDEIYDRLVRLDSAIERAEETIDTYKGLRQDAGEFHKSLRQAEELRGQAELAWDASHYSNADKFIKEAHNALQEIPPPPPKPAKPWLIPVIIAAVTIAIVVPLIIRRRRMIA